jgi:hypothetical protein
MSPTHGLKLGWCDMNRPAWPGLLLAILACLAIMGAVWWSRNEAEQKNIPRNIKTWEELEKKVHPKA